MNELPSEIFWGGLLAVFLIFSWIFRHFELTAGLTNQMPNHRTTPPDPNELFADITEETLHEE